MKMLNFCLAMLLIVLISTLNIFGSVTLTDITFETTQPTEQLVSLLRAKFGAVNTELQQISSLATQGTGKYYYVDSGVGSDTYIGDSWAHAKATLDAAINLCTANNGDVIWVAQGHAESYTAADGFDADKAGITIIGLGSGTDRPEFTFADTDATVAIGAANVTLYNLAFLGGISEVVTGISIEAAGDYARIINCIFPEPTTSTWEFDKTIVLASGADNVLIQNCIAYSADATGATDFIDVTAGVVNGLMFVGNLIHGEYANAPIYSDQINLEALILDNVVTNMTTGQFAIEFSAATTGMCIGNLLFSDAYATTLDPGSMKCIENYAVAAIDKGAALIPAASVGQTVYDILMGADGITTFPAGSAAANAVSMAEVLRYAQENIIVGTGTALPTNTSLYGVLAGATGISTFPAGAAAADTISMAEVLRYAQENIIIGTGTTLPSNTSLYGCLAGATGVTTYPAAAAYGNGVSIAEVLGYVQEAVRNTSGSPMPAGYGLYDFIAGANGVDVWPAAAAYANNISLAEVIAYIQDGVRRGTGTAMAANKSMADALGTNGVTLVDDAGSIAGILGYDDADNAYASTNVADNADGSILERLEHVQADTDKIDGATLAVSPTAGSLARFIASGGTALGTALADSKSIVDALGSNGTTLADNATSIIGVLGVDDADNAMATTNIVSNENGSVFERLESIQTNAEVHYNRPQYFTVEANMASATWNTAAAHEVVTVTGTVRIRVLIECTETLTDAADTATIALGTEGATTSWIAATGAAGSGATTIDIEEIWQDTTPAELESASYSTAMLDKTVINGSDIGYTIGTAALTDGTLIFHIWWEALDSTGVCAAGAGGAL